jgi:hypothetical protein
MSPEYPYNSKQGKLAYIHTPAYLQFAVATYNVDNHEMQSHQEMQASLGMIT